MAYRRRRSFRRSFRRGRRRSFRRGRRRRGRVMTTRRLYRKRAGRRI